MKGLLLFLLINPTHGDEDFERFLCEANKAIFLLRLSSTFKGFVSIRVIRVQKLTT